MIGDRPLAGMRIGLVTSWASRRGGGVFEAVVRQAAMIRGMGGEAHVFALDDDYAAADAGRFAPSPVSTFPVIGPQQVGIAPALGDALIEADLDLLHLHGIWMYPSRAATLWRRRTGRPYLISAHGMLDPTTVHRRPWKKALGRWLYEGASWQAADAFHALTAIEAANIRVQSPHATITVIANAAPAVSLASPLASRAARFVFLGRIHPQKNLDGLLAAWTEAGLDSEAELVIAGWGDSADVARLERQVAHAGPSVRFVGPVHGKAKDELLASARFLVLPSRGEAMPIVVLEAWSAGLPAIVSHHANLPEGIDCGAALACDVDPPSIAAALRQAMNVSEEGYAAMVGAAQALAEGPFSAGTIAARWAAFYRDLSSDREARR